MSDTEKNSCDILVEGWKNRGADSLGVYKCDEIGMITVEPLNSKTGQSWSEALITSIEEAQESKYPKVFRNDKDYDTFVKYIKDKKATK